MDKAALLNRANDLARKVSGNTRVSVIERIIEAGTVPEGATIAVTGRLSARAFADRIEQYNPGTGEIAKVTPIDSDRLRESVLVQYAVFASQGREGTE